MVKSKINDEMKCPEQTEEAKIINQNTEEPENKETFTEFKMKKIPTTKDKSGIVSGGVEI